MTTENIEKLNARSMAVQQMITIDNVPLDSYIENRIKFAGGVGGLAYTINGNMPDEQNDFKISRESFGAALSSHTHTYEEIISDNGLSNLTQTLSSKSDISHTHDMVNGITIGDKTLVGNVTLVPGENITLNVDNQNIEMLFNIETAEMAGSVDAIIEQNEKENYYVFVGTRAEWDAYEKPINKKILVYLT